MVSLFQIAYYIGMAKLPPPSGRESGFACSNCQSKVLEFEEGIRANKEGDMEPNFTNECFCTRGLYKTNITRDALAKNFWKRVT